MEAAVLRGKQTKTAPGDGPPGVKTIWKGLQKLYTLLDYRELFDFVGQA
jgi:hypothetical protein